MPSASVATTTTRKPASTADAAFVPCALDGMRQMSRSGLAVGAWSRGSREAGELALAAGVRLQRDGVVAGDLGEPGLELLDQPERPDDVCLRRERVRFANAGQVMACISVAALSFIVHDPSGIMPRSSA